MATSAEWHEDYSRMSTQALDFSRAVKSVQEELEAVDWYNQRADACRDPELKAILEHNRDEEKEHACMTLEWIRRHDPAFDRLLRAILFRAGPIEAEAADGRGDGDGSLGIGSLRPEAAR